MRDASTTAAEREGRRGRALPGILHERLLRPVQAFIGTEASGGLAVLAAIVVALAWANSPWSASYFDLWASPIRLETGLFSVDETVGKLINDGLMAIFFFVVGLEIKRELLLGELSTRRKAALPVVAACGGMVVPALIYVAFNADGDGSRGWGIPMATDIALALGVLALLGRRVPFALKVFLLALAVVDDLGAILVIAVFYTDSLSLDASLAALAILALISGARAAGVRSVDVYVILGICFWFAVLKSGVHATVAGVVLAMLTPAKADAAIGTFQERAGGLLERLRGETQDDREATQVLMQEFEAAVREAEAPLERLERQLHPWSVFVIVPVFALANAGIEVTGDALSGAASSGVSAGVFFGLVLGKPLGVVFAAWLAVKVGLAALPATVGWRHIAGAGVLAGIGFTVSLFVTGLAFSDQGLEEEAKLAILAASLLAAVAGLALLRFAAPGVATGSAR